SESYLQTFIAKRTDPTFWPLLFHSFLTSLFILFLSFALGTSMLGVVLSPILLLIRGFLYGSVAALLYRTYAVKGIAFHAVLILPAAFFLIIALLLAARESVQFSLQIAKISLPASSAGDLSADFANFCGRYLVLSGLVFLSAVTDAAMSCAFADHFTIG
ncbi:MAG: stage II sporulation protein M, partial [Clostridia bacterium]|nr:stage II sporulation protein M [Clostridia bacterium]